LLNLTGHNDVPLPRFVLNGTRFDRSFNGAMDLDFERANFGERDMLLLERKACLWIGKARIPIAPLKPGVAGLLAILHALKEPLKRLLEPE